MGMRMLENLSIRAKFLLLPIIATMLMALLGGLFLASQQAEKQLLERINDHDLPKMRELSRLFSEFSTNHVKFINLLALSLRDGVGEGDIYAQGRKNITAVNSTIKALKALEVSYRLNGVEHAIYEQLSRHLVEYRDQMGSTVLMSSVELHLITQFTLRANTSYDAANSEFLSFIDAVEARTQRDFIHVQSTVEQNRFWFFVVLGAAIVLVAVASGLLASLFSADLKSTIQRLTRLTRGDMTLDPIDHRRRDEFGAVDQVIEVFREALIERDRVEEDLKQEIAHRQNVEHSLRISEEQVRLLLDSTGEAIYGVDKKGDCTFANPACVSILGYNSIDELIGASVLQLIHEKGGGNACFSEHDNIIVRAICHGERLSTEDEEIWCKSGDAIPVEVRVTPMEHQGQVVGSVVTFSDITERKKAQGQILSMNADLERRVRARTQDLQTANTQLENFIVTLRETQKQLVQSEKMAALGGLVAGVAHEINTPIGVGVTAASHLALKLQEYSQRYQDGQLTRNEFETMLATGLESSEMVLANLERAAELISSFKQVAVDQSSDERRAFKLKNYIEEVLQSLTPKLKRTQHTVAINCEEDVSLYSYPGAFSQIITNLFMNSLVHGFDEIAAGTINIDIIRQNDWVCIKYADNGKGIPQSYIDKIFDPFFTTKRGSGGTGLGMHIVFNLVTHTLGGRIECFSPPNEGVVFKIDCPISLDEIEPGKHSLSTAHSTSSRFD